MNDASLCKGQGWPNSKKATQYLGIPPGNLRQKVHRRQIHAQGKVGRALMFKKEALDALMQGSLERSLGPK